MHAIECSECKVKRQLVSWNWAYTWLGAAWWGCWELNSCPLEEHKLLFTTESSFYPLLFVFNQINPIVNYHCFSVKMVKIKTVTHQTLANFTVTEFLINCGWGCKMSQPPVLATFGCQLDFIWNEVKPKLLGTSMRTFFLLKWEVPLIIQVFWGGKTNL